MVLWLLLVNWILFVDVDADVDDGFDDAIVVAVAVAVVVVVIGIEDPYECVEEGQGRATFDINFDERGITIARTNRWILPLLLSSSHSVDIRLRLL